MRADKSTLTTCMGIWITDACQCRLRIDRFSVEQMLEINNSNFIDMKIVKTISDVMYEMSIDIVGDHELSETHDGVMSIDKEINFVDENNVHRLRIGEFPGNVSSKLQHSQFIEMMLLNPTLDNNVYVRVDCK